MSTEVQSSTISFPESPNFKARFQMCVLVCACACGDVGRHLISDVQMHWASLQRREGVLNPDRRRALASAKERWNGT